MIIIYRLEHRDTRVGPFSDPRVYGGCYVAEHKPPQCYGLVGEEWKRMNEFLNVGALFAWETMEQMDWFIRKGWRDLRERGFVVAQIEVERHNTFIFEDGQTIYTNGVRNKIYDIRDFLRECDAIKFGEVK